VDLISEGLKQLELRQPHSDFDEFVDAQACCPTRGGTLSVVFDFETTGIGKTRDVRITQVGAQALRKDLSVASTFTRFVNPRKPISEGATKLTGIGNEVVCDLPDWSIVGKDFAHWVQGALVDSGADDVTLIAHNGKCDFVARVGFSFRDPVD
jgi:DNA polymerase III alpha subunit (gram-positive type)